MSYVGFVNYNSGGNKPIAHTLYGSCGTAAGTAAKTVTLADFDKLLDGVTIKIKFTYANTVASPTLNINSTGAKAIQKASGTAVAAADSWKAGQVVSFTYDNTAGAWIMNDFRDYASTSAPGIVKLESTPTFNLTAKGTGGSTSNVVTTSGLYAAYDNLLGAIGTETLNSGFGSNVSIKAAINSLYTTCIGANFYESFNTRYSGFELSSTVATTDNAGALWNSIKGNIKGIGDYFWIKLNNTNVKCRIAGRNIYKDCGDTALGDHYTIVTDTAFQSVVYYPANDTSGGTKSSGNTSTKQAFLGSDLWNLTLGADPSTGAAVITTGINSILYSIFGNSLLKYRDLSTNSINKTAMSSAGAGWTGSSNGWEWHDCYATLLNECELYGGPVFSSSGYDIGIKKAQLPLFALNPELISLRSMWYWLKNVASGSDFCHCCNDGLAGDLGASGSFGLRLEFQLSI